MKFLNATQVQLQKKDVIIKAAVVLSLQCIAQISNVIIKLAVVSSLQCIDQISH